MRINTVTLLTVDLGDGGKGYCSTVRGGGFCQEPSDGKIRGQSHYCTPAEGYLALLPYLTHSQPSESRVNKTDFTKLIKASCYETKHKMVESEFKIQIYSIQIGDILYI